LQGNLTILYHPERHFHAHQRHREFLREIGIEVERYSRANHPIELRELVRQGYRMRFSGFMERRLTPHLIGRQMISSTRAGSACSNQCLEDEVDYLLLNLGPDF
jgi:hypothetical protein